MNIRASIAEAYDVLNLGQVRWPFNFQILIFKFVQGILTRAGENPVQAGGRQPKQIKFLATRFHDNLEQIALRTHPDKNSGNPDATQEFQRVSEAYHILLKHLDKPSGSDESFEDYPSDFDDYDYNDYDGVYSRLDLFTYVPSHTLPCSFKPLIIGCCLRCSCEMKHTRTPVNSPST